MSDRKMWSNLSGQKLNKEQTLWSFGRCKTLILEMFCGAMILTALAAAAGWPVSQPTDIEMDGIDLLVPTDRRAIEEQIERDDPFCLVMPFPCGPWNSLTYWNASRHPEFKIRNEALQKKHVPMLKWLCSIAKKRIARGRLVLMENGQTSRAWNLKCFEELEGLLDGLQSDASFEYGIGDQCLLGQHDRESGEPMRGRTKWGTNGEILKQNINPMWEQ